MARRNFSQILKEASVDIRREYDRLYSTFYIRKVPDANGVGYSLKEYCASNFLNMPFRKTCLSLDDFDDFYGIYFEKNPSDFNLDFLILFCEYTYNLALYMQPVGMFGYMGVLPQNQLYLQQVSKVIESIGYMPIQDGNVTIFVPKSAEAVAVSEIIEPSLSYKVIEYNHHTMQGNIEGKKSILLLLGDKLEGQRAKLKQINKTLEDSIFTLLNNLNLRHNNIDTDSKEYNSFVATMPKKEIESWYDEVYQLCLLAFLEIDNVERARKVKELKQKLDAGR